MGTRKAVLACCLLLALSLCLAIGIAIGRKGRTEPGWRWGTTITAIDAITGKPIDGFLLSVESGPDNETSILVAGLSPSSQKVYWNGTEALEIRVGAEGYHGQTIKCEPAIERSIEVRLVPR